MADESAKAKRYEKRFPGTGVDESVKEERIERIEFKEERQGLSRTGRNRGVVIPALPWKED